MAPRPEGPKRHDWLDIGEWILQDGSDDAYEDKLPEDLRYPHEPEILRRIHGDPPKAG